jgi:hypothetical protein
MSAKPKLFILVDTAKHFLKWEIPEFEKYFTLVDAPSKDAALFSFGPDVFEAAATMPAKVRVALLLPGFSRNPVYNKQLRDKQRKLIKEKFDHVFINPGPLEIAYKDLKNVSLCPITLDTELATVKRYRSSLNSLLHVSSDYPQKDWQRS